REPQPGLPGRPIILAAGRSPAEPATRTAWASSDGCQILADLLELIGRRLIDLVDPVAEEQMRVGTPAVERPASGIVVGIIFVRHAHRYAGGDVAVVLFLERGRVVFDVVEHIEPVSRSFGE